MRLLCIIGLGTTLLASVTGATANAGEAWKTYRNETFGYEISYPAEMEYTAYVNGASGELKAAGTGHRLVDFAVWPPGECPRQPADASASEVGIERAKAMTQADGPEGSSSCGDPVTACAYASLHGATIYELDLTCRRETYPEAHDDTVDAEPDAVPTDTQPVLTTEGKKGPTYFVDISPPWSKRILLADPVGVDPRMPETTGKIDLSVLREILGTLKTLPIQKPPGACIEELQNRGFSIGSPPR